MFCAEERPGNLSEAEPAERSQGRTGVRPMRILSHDERSLLLECEVTGHGGNNLH